MLNNEPITLDKLKELVELLEPKTIFLNKKNYDLVLEQIDFEPSNVVIINYLSDNQAMIMNNKQIEDMKKGYFITEIF